MALYKVVFPTIAAEKRINKVLSKIPNNVRQKMLDQLESLESNPRPVGAGSFKRLNPPIDIFGMTAHYRLRVGDYRIIYDVDDKIKTVWVLDLRKRNEITYK